MVTLVISLSLLRRTAFAGNIDVTAIEILRLLQTLSAQLSFETLAPGSVLPRGATVCTATATVNAWTIFSIIYRFMLGPLVTLGRNVYRFRRLGYNVAPHFAPGWKRKGARKQKKTLYGTIIHDREVLAPLSFPKQASSP